MDTDGTDWSEVRNHFKTSFQKTLFNKGCDNVLEKSMHDYGYYTYPQSDPNY